MFEAERCLLEGSCHALSSQVDSKSGTLQRLLEVAAYIVLVFDMQCNDYIHVIFRSRIATIRHVGRHVGRNAAIHLLLPFVPICDASTSFYLDPKTCST